MNYRPEVDGLRAVAVISVILFHAGFSGFGGGFVGVDVFFVISGYLITTIVLSELQQGKFSLLGFYERRARRILPALFLVISVCIVFSWFWLMPADMKAFAESLLAVITFSSNVFFWRESGYWDAASEMKPMLHTWSLAVEEQYYILFPIFMVLMWRYRRRWLLPVLALVAVGSLALSHWGAYHEPTANFYLLPTRGWELAVGAGIAYYFSNLAGDRLNFQPTGLLSELLGLGGLLMIAYAVIVFDARTPFPSLYALIPTLGAGLVIAFSSEKTLVGRILSLRPVVLIGLISYGAYLWHQPLFAFSRQHALAKPDGWVLAILSLSSFFLAYLSWRFVESPFRHRHLFGRRQIFALSAVGSAVILLFAVAGFFSNGFDGRAKFQNPPASEMERKLGLNYGLSDACEGEYTFLPACRTHDEPELLVWGDSYAMHLVRGILASKPDAKIVQMTKSDCGPIYEIAPTGLPKYPVGWSHECLEFNRQVLDRLADYKSVKFVLLSSPFIQYLEHGGRLMFRNQEIVDADLELVAVEFRRTLTRLKAMGVTPVVFSPPPSNGVDLGRCLATAKWGGDDLVNCDFPQGDISKGRLMAYELLREMGKDFSVIFLTDLMCDSGVCKTHIGDIFLYRDTGHLSVEGAAALGQQHDFYRMVVGP